METGAPDQRCYIINSAGEGLELVNAINQLKELTKVNIVIDNVTLANNGIDMNSAQVSVKKQGVKARNVHLRSCLRDPLLA